MAVDKGCVSAKFAIMEWLLIVLAFIVIIAGIGGCVLPVIPGPPIAFVGMLILHFAGEDYSFSFTKLLIYGLLAVLVTVIDYIVPVWGTKKFGGTKYGTWGSTIGLILGAIVFPFFGIVLGPFGLFGIILGPFFGAVIGEKIGGMDSGGAMKAGMGSFIGFLAGTLIKLVYSFIVLFVAIGQVI